MTIISSQSKEIIHEISGFPSYAIHRKGEREWKWSEERKSRPGDCKNLNLLFQNIAVERRKRSENKKRERDECDGRQKSHHRWWWRRWSSKKQQIYFRYHTQNGDREKEENCIKAARITHERQFFFCVLLCNANTLEPFIIDRGRLIKIVYMIKTNW